jgi:uncharacterized membrane protein
MAELTEKQKKKLQLLEESLGVKQEEAKPIAENATSNPILCASLKREEQLQYHFMFIYQMIVLIFAVIVLALLIFAGWRIATGAAFQAVIAGVGALVSGAAAAFLLKQRADARDTYKAAQAGLVKYTCSE